MRGLPTRLSVPIIAVQSFALLLVLYVTIIPVQAESPTLATDTAFVFGVIFPVETAGILALLLMAMYVERETRRTFVGQSNWRHLQTNFQERLRMSDRLERVMLEDCPKELEWIRRVP